MRREPPKGNKTGQRKCTGRPAGFGSGGNCRGTGDFQPSLKTRAPEPEDSGKGGGGLKKSGPRKWNSRPGRGFAYFFYLNKKHTISFFKSINLKPPEGGAKPRKPKFFGKMWITINNATLTLNPNPKPYNPNPKPYNPNPKPYNLNPKP